MRFMQINNETRNIFVDFLVINFRVNEDVELISFPLLSTPIYRQYLFLHIGILCLFCQQPILNFFFFNKPPPMLPLELLLVYSMLLASAAP